MGYLRRVRIASFFAGAATALSSGLYILHNDYKIAYSSISHQVKEATESLERRISMLEQVKEGQPEEEGN